MRHLLSFALAATTAAAQSPTFAEPVRLNAGEKLLGEARLYPSPVYHDVNSDGRADIVVGDLWGRVTVALRAPGSGSATFGAEEKMTGADGENVDLHNW